MSSPKEKEGMNEFSSPSQLRSFEICTLGGSLFINAHWMAELSPYFEQLCFGSGFSEALTGRVLLETVEHGDVLAMLEYLCPDRNHILKKRIDDKNLAALIHCSHRFQVPSLSSELEKFIGGEMREDSCHLKPETLVEAILEADSAAMRSSLIRHLHEKLADAGDLAVREAVKGLAPETAAAIITETAKYMRIIQTPALRSVYDWNSFDQRAFF